MRGEGDRKLAASERKERERAEREERIKRAARAIAEREGWSAVTIRRLADEIEHSQPVLYSHFASRDAIVAAVAAEGFRELALTLGSAARGSSDREHALRIVAMAYLGFARDYPALYEAMFTLPSGLRFAEADTRQELRTAFAALASVVGWEDDDGTVTETLWAALHGFAELERSGRIRRSAREERVALLVRALLA